MGAAAGIVGPGCFPKKAVTACTLALIEAVDNAIFHAHCRRKKVPIGLSLTVSDGSVSIEVVDCGPGIGRAGREKPDSFASHGRGLFLIHRLMHNVTSRMKGGRHSLRMVYKL